MNTFIFMGLAVTLLANHILWGQTENNIMESLTLFLIAAVLVTGGSIAREIKKLREDKSAD